MDNKIIQTPLTDSEFLKDFRTVGSMSIAKHNMDNFHTKSMNVVNDTIKELVGVMELDVREHIVIKHVVNLFDILKTQMISIITIKSAELVITNAVVDGLLVQRMLNTIRNDINTFYDYLSKIYLHAMPQLTRTQIDSSDLIKKYDEQIHKLTWELFSMGLQYTENDFFKYTNNYGDKLSK